MPVLVVPRFASQLSPFMMSATLAGLLAESGLEGAEPAAAGAERLPDDHAGPLVLR